MTNYVLNRLSLKNTGPGFNELINTFTKPEITSGGIFNALIKMPEDLSGTEIPNLDYLLANLENPIVDECYRWRASCRGTLEDIFKINIIYSSSEEFVIEFETLFAPPILIYQEISEQYKELSFFVAIWAPGCEMAQCLEYSPNVGCTYAHLECFLRDQTSAQQASIKLPSEIKAITKKFKDPLPHEFFKHGRFS